MSTSNLHMLKRNSTIVILLCLSFCIGFFLRCWYEIGTCQINTTINALDAISLIATIILGVYIAKTLQKEVQDKRIEKDMYLGLISAIEQIIRDIDNLVENSGGNNLHYNRIVNVMHRCRIKKVDVFKALGSINNGSLKSKIDDCDQKLKTELRILKTALTETSVKASSTPSVKLKKNMVTYSDERRIEIITSINAIESSLFKLKILVNNL